MEDSWDGWLVEAEIPVAEGSFSGGFASMLVLLPESVDEDLSKDISNGSLTDALEGMAKPSVYDSCAQDRLDAQGLFNGESCFRVMMSKFRFYSKAGSHFKKLPSRTRRLIAPGT